MAWHIIHSLLEQVRLHSTFPGKLWIIMMFIFRIVVVARIGDMVYHDEQSHFVCNTLSPGCSNVCFNAFSPISQLRFWSLMVLVVSSPGVLFCIYASHKIYHAYVKFPLAEEEGAPKSRTWDTASEIDRGSEYGRPIANGKRRKGDSPPAFTAHPTAPPLYVVKRLNSKNNEKLDKNGKPEISRRVKSGNYDAPVRKRHRRHGNDEEKDLMEKRKGSTTDNNYTSNDDVRIGRKWRYVDHPSRQQTYPIYSDSRGRKVEYISVGGKPNYYDEIKANKQNKIMLENPQLYRAYWWHVVIRTVLEIGFLVGQYYLYGWFVPELFECKRWPCPKTVDCFVSRPMEKTCLLWLMFGLGAIACVLSIGEFWALGWERFKYACCCRGHKMTYEEKRRRLALLQASSAHPPKQPEGNKDEIIVMHGGGGMTGALSLDSLSSDTTVESV
uniref:gap junction gamma-1 protein isoform X3 n=1 Tax=Ciona intestinalis TaxID=7719 RepID=UPI000180CF66|nr:gap junction gamma-1 protein isoform X3 [Ciona intestinalis]|eukprot:XP_026692389.1 gap junction gamma-1 protein isoform X3 [Ciona intestinalis]